ncbi:MAG TPA: energy transducer TonB [Thermoanaerobaculia bacterium]|nr:energy transducer TonB [Thermoanaerobaculia bacterium]
MKRTKLLALLAPVLFLLAAAEGPPYRVGGEVTPPVKISGADPVYTELARRARLTGVVIVEALIDERGSVTSSRVLKGLPMGLDKAAIAAVETWKFKAAALRGTPVAAYFVVTVNFQLESDFDFGPAYSAFLSDHADVRELVEKDEYDEAGELIDRFLLEVPGENSLLLGRAYMHLGEDDVEDAWHVAESVTGPERAEIAQSIAAKAAELLRTDPAAPAGDREKRADVGIAASALAVGLTADGGAERAATALRTRADLLRLKAALTDPPDDEKLLDEARALAARADELHPAGRIYP